MTTHVNKQFLGIDKDAYTKVNDLRLNRKYSWNMFFKHLAQYEKDLKLLLNRDIEPSLCTVKSMHTVSALLPKWCDNIAQNMGDVLNSGDISCLVCKTRANNECYKLAKLKTFLHDTIEHEPEEVAKACGLPVDMINYLVRQVITYHFVSVAGSQVCEGCENRISANKPALIISGGPSLRDHNQLDLLKQYGFNGDIFVVSKSLKETLEHGIVPNFVGSLDAEEFDTSFINHDIVDQYADQMTGLFGITIHPTTWKRWKGKRYYFSGYLSENETPNISHTFHLMTRTTTLSVSGNVGSCLYNIAAYLGYNPIVMIGMDLSFPSVESMKSYYPNASDEDWKKTITVGSKERPMYKKAYNPDFQKHYYMDSVFESYVISHRTWAQSLASQGITTINCSEQGGLHSKYIKSMKFEEYLKTQNNI